MKKRIFALLLCICMLCSGTVFAETETKPITILIDGEPLAVPVDPVLINDRTMLPMRAIFEALGARVSWAGDDQMIFATKGDCLMVLKIGVPTMSVQRIGNNENVSVTLDVAPYLHEDGHTMVPARAIAEELKAKVDWDGATQTVIITRETTE